MKNSSFGANPRCLSGLVTGEWVAGVQPRDRLWLVWSQWCLMSKRVAGERGDSISYTCHSDWYMKPQTKRYFTRWGMYWYTTMRRLGSVIKMKIRFSYKKWSLADVYIEKRCPILIPWRSNTNKGRVCCRPWLGLSAPRQSCWVLPGLYLWRHIVVSHRWGSGPDCWLGPL